MIQFECEYEFKVVVNYVFRKQLTEWKKKRRVINNVYVHCSNL